MPKSPDWDFISGLSIVLNEEMKQHDLPRIAFEASGRNGIIHMRPRDRETAPRGELPSIGMVAGWPSLCDLCLRAGIYIAAWRGRDGAVVFVDVFNGNEKRRYEATTQRELEGAISAAAAFIGG